MGHGRSIVSLVVMLEEKVEWLVSRLFVIMRWAKMRARTLSLSFEGLFLWNTEK